MIADMVAYIKNVNSLLRIYGDNFKTTDYSKKVVWNSNVSFITKKITVKRIADVVYISGRVKFTKMPTNKNGEETVLCTLPEEIRPGDVIPLSVYASVIAEAKPVVAVSQTKGILFWNGGTESSTATVYFAGEYCL